MPQLTLDLSTPAPALPRGLAPMLARPGPPPVAGAHVCDVAWGGLRVLAAIEADGTVRLGTIAGRDIAGHVPEVASALRASGLRAAILDGELVVPDAWGGHDAARLRARFAPRHAGPEGGTEAPVSLVVADLLWLGSSLLGRPLGWRRERLAATLQPASHLVPLPPLEGAPWRLVQELAGRAPALIAKRVDSPYLPGVRSRLWRRLDLTRAAAETGAPPAEPEPGASRTPPLAGLLRLPLG